MTTNALAAFTAGVARAEERHGPVRATAPVRPDLVISFTGKRSKQLIEYAPRHAADEEPIPNERDLPKVLEHMLKLDRWEPLGFDREGDQL